MKRVSIKEIDNLDCFRAAVREGEDTVAIYPNLKWDNPKLKEVNKDNLTDTSFEYDKSKEK